MATKVKSSREVASGFLVCMACFVIAAWAMSEGCLGYAMFGVAMGMVSVIMMTKEVVDRMDGDAG